MTRFLLDIEDAINLILKSQNYKNCNLIPISKSFSVKDLFEIYNEEFGLSYDIGIPRVGEKIHEIMASSEEVRRMSKNEKDNIYILHPQRDVNNLEFINNEYSSRDYCITKEDLRNFLKNKNFYK